MSLESNLMPPLIISPAKKRSLGFMKGPEGLAGMSSPRDGHSKELQSPIRSPGSGGRSRRAGAGGRGSAARAADVDSVQRAAATTPAHGTSTRANGPDSVQAALAALNLPGSQWLAGGQDDRPRVREKIDVLLENDMRAGSRVVKGSS